MTKNTSFLLVAVDCCSKMKKMMMKNGVLQASTGHVSEPRNRSGRMETLKTM